MKVTIPSTNLNKSNSTDNIDSKVLLVEVPRNNDKKELSAEQMFAAIHGILKPAKRRLVAKDQEHISFEIAVFSQQIRFYIWTPSHLQNFVESQIYAQYSTAQIIQQSTDYASRVVDANTNIQAAELGLNQHTTLPIRTFLTFEVDPLSGITAVLSRLSLEEEIWIQVLTKPISDSWHQLGNKHSRRIKTGGFDLTSFISAPFRSPTKTPDTPTELSERQKSQIAGIESKITKLGYQVKIRIIYLSPKSHFVSFRLQEVVGAFKQFNTTDLNGFRTVNVSNHPKNLLAYRDRQFRSDGFILNTEELASLFHLPNSSVDTPHIVWASSKTAEPPSNVPTLSKYSSEEVSLFAKTNFRNLDFEFGCLRSDRGRHIYVIGQTGTGKSGLLELLSLSDLKNKQGYAIIDPHGDFANNNLRAIPKERIKDVVYFNPADVDYPIGFNPLEINDPNQKNQVSSELVGVMKRMFDSWGPRLEYILRNTLLALLDTPNSTMLDITRMLTEKNFRKRVVGRIQDIVVRNFWEVEFGNWDSRFRNEAIAPVLNKVGAFISNPMVRNIIGQPKSSFNIRKMMDEGKILILNLSRGLIGEHNAYTLGAMMVTKIQLAAMSRADIPNIEDRRPFYLYVDEFQNFATDSFAVILSEARKYGLCLTLANQYISQVPEEVMGAVFGNVGSLVTFRASANDGPFLEKYFQPNFEMSDIIQLANRNFITALTIDGEKADAFSGRTIDIPACDYDLSSQIIEHSRANYALPKAEVEELVRDTSPYNNQQQHKTLANNQVLQKLKKGFKGSGKDSDSGGSKKNNQSGKSSQDQGNKPRPNPKVGKPNKSKNTNQSSDKSNKNQDASSKVSPKQTTNQTGSKDSLYPKTVQDLPQTQTDKIKELTEDKQPQSNRPKAGKATDKATNQKKKPNRKAPRQTTNQTKPKDNLYPKTVQDLPQTQTDKIKELTEDKQPQSNRPKAGKATDKATNQKKKPNRKAPRQTTNQTKPKDNLYPKTVQDLPQTQTDKIKELTEEKADETAPVGG